MDNSTYTTYTNFILNKQKSLKTSSANSSILDPTKEKENSIKQIQKTIKNKLKYTSTSQSSTNEFKKFTSNKFHKMKLNGTITSPTKFDLNIIQTSGRSPRYRNPSLHPKFSEKETNLKTETSSNIKEKRDNISHANYKQESDEKNVCKSLEVDKRGIISSYSTKNKYINTNESIEIPNQEFKAESKDLVIEKLNLRIYDLESKLFELHHIIKENQQARLNTTQNTIMNTETNTKNILITSYHETENDINNTISCFDSTGNKNFNSKNKILGVSKIKKIQTKFTNFHNIIAKNKPSLKMKLNSNKNLVLNVDASSNSYKLFNQHSSSNIKNKNIQVSSINKYTSISKGLSYLNLFKPFPINKPKNQTVLDIYNKSSPYEGKIIKNKTTKTSYEKDQTKAIGISVKSSNISPSGKINRNQFLINEIKRSEGDSNSIYEDNDNINYNKLQFEANLEKTTVSVTVHFAMIKERTKDLLTKLTNNNFKLIQNIRKSSNLSYSKI